MRVRQYYPNYHAILNFICFGEFNADPVNHNFQQIKIMSNYEKGVLIDGTLY